MDTHILKSISALLVNVQRFTLLLSNQLALSVKADSRQLYRSRTGASSCRERDGWGSAGARSH
jgi:hypothetical protein